MMDIPIQNEDFLGAFRVDCMFSRNGNVVEKAKT
jgi:hypothetical protein